MRGEHRKRHLGDLLRVPHGAIDHRATQLPDPAVVGRYFSPQRALQAAAVGQNENVTRRGDTEGRMKHEIVARKIEGSDGLTANTRGWKECTHLWLHQALPTHDGPERFMQVGNIDALCAFNEDSIDSGDSFVYD